MDPVGLDRVVETKPAAGGPILFRRCATANDAATARRAAATRVAMATAGQTVRHATATVVPMQAGGPTATGVRVATAVPMQVGGPMVRPAMVAVVLMATEVLMVSAAPTARLAIDRKDRTRAPSPA